MATDRFQRWLKRKNQSIEAGRPTEADPFIEAAQSIKTSQIIDQETSTKPDNQANKAVEPVLSKESENTATNEHLTENKIQPATLAHVFAQGFDKQDKKNQLRNLFHSGKFSEVDPLDSYNMDYTQVKPLAKDIADTLRSWHKEVEKSLDELEETKDDLAALHNKIESEGDASTQVDAQQQSITKQPFTKQSITKQSIIKQSVTKDDEAK